MTINQLPPHPRPLSALEPWFRVALRQVLGPQAGILNREREPTLIRKGT